MKRSLLFLLGFFCLVNTFSQNRYKIWCFGNRAGLDFNTSPPTPTNTSAMNQVEGCASICDNNTGQLLFYTHGVTIWNRNNQVMLNGTGLQAGQSSTQAALIVPKPGSNTVYYVFTAPEQGTVSPLSYSIVDMTLDGGLGAVTIKNVALQLNMSERLTATLKSNGTDYWVVTKEFGTNVFYTYSVTSAGVDPTPVISATGLATTNTQDVIGYAKISHNGSKLCIAYWRSCISQLFDFNNSTGIVSNPINLVSPTVTSGPYGVEFSPDDSKLYIMQISGFVLRQYNLLAGSPGAIQNSMVEIVNLGGTGFGSGIMLGPDGKMYATHYPEGFLSVVNQPNLTGAASNFVLHAITLSAGTTSQLGLPNNINYPVNLCPPGQNIGNSVSICPNQTYQLPWGPVVSTAGIYSDTIRNQAATCDSIIHTINLSVYTATLLNTNAHICPNQTYQLPSGTIVSAEGIYLDTLTNSAGCDSIINTIHLFVDHATLQNTDAHICPGQTFTLPSGTIVSVEGIYLDTLRSQASCDSIINTTHLFIDHAVLQNVDAHICPNQTYQLPSGTIVSAEGIYLDTLRSQASCDSIINTIHLFIDHAVLLNTSASICSNQTYQLPSGLIVSSSGIYLDTLRSQASCDSIINTIHLIVNDQSYTNQADSIFAGQNYTLPSGIVVSSPGTYQSVLVNSLGCDSIITTTLTLRKTLAECITLKNAITPNGDGVNDYWILYRYPCFKKLEVHVYNRYGSLIYQSPDYKNDWDGKYKGKELPDGTYYYVIKVYTYDNKEPVFKNNLTILR